MTSGPETSTALQRASLESKALIIGVERAYVALRDARNDFERLIVRDKAQAIVAAAEVLKRRDIQTEASILVAAAEREIAKANPPIPPEQRSPGRGGNTVPPENGIPQSTVRKIRQAHDKLTDEQFAAASDKAREQGEPLTPNPPKDTEGRREDSGRVGEGAIGEMAGLHWGRLEVGGRSSVAA